MKMGMVLLRAPVLLLILSAAALAASPSPVDPPCTDMPPAGRCTGITPGTCSENERLFCCATCAGDTPPASPRFVVEDETVGWGGDALVFKVLHNRATGEKVEVIPELGGKTEALLLQSKQHAGTLRPVLLDHARNVTAIRSNVGWKGAMLIPYANRIANGTYTLNGKTYYLERNEPRPPWGSNALHGYLYRHAMDVVSESEPNDSAARLVLGYQFDGTDPGYPFPLRVNLTYELSDEGFKVTTVAENMASATTGGRTGSTGKAAKAAKAGAGPLPFYNGWHSYFKVGDISKATLTLDRCSGWNHIDVGNGGGNVKGLLIPTGLTTPFSGFDGTKPVGGTTAVPTYWDDEFKATASTAACPVLKTRVTDGDTKDTAVLWQSEGSRFVQVFSGTKKNFGQQAIAVEAMSSEADSWNNLQGINVLQAGETWQGSFGVQLE